MDANGRLELILRSPTEEFLVESELEAKLKSGEPLKHYIGYEISGLVHLGQLLTAFKIADLQKAGVETRVLMADFHTIINNKLGGDAEFIRKVANEYFKKTIETGIEIGGGDPKKTKFTMASEIYNNDYWMTVLRVGNQTTLSRALRSISIMGRDEKEGVPTAWVLYPLMQAADIFHQGLNIAHAGLDQRKIHVIARDVGMKIAGYKPMAIHNHMLLGLRKPSVWPVPEDKEGKWQTFKMSKSVKGSAVFVNDSEEEITKKVNSAFCPEGETGYNPVLDWTKHVVFAPQLKGVFEIHRDEKYGGNSRYTDYESVEADFISGKLHPSDLKSGLAKFVVDLLAPFRREFEGNELVSELKKRITR
ncbi:MAG: tyrosine--tRNA ligase [Candidatus Altiarchaeota archaeon]|nr:tyrosine--tRNA ligase [Candidatus Altiarchaeota archaeon]